MPRTYQNEPRQKAIRKFLRQEPVLAEKILWKFLRNNQLGYKFRRQFGIGHYVVDFYCHPLRLILEVDGWTHDFEKTQQKDGEKQIFLEKSGYKVIRFKNEEVYGDVGVLLEKIKNVCETRNAEITGSVE